MCDGGGKSGDVAGAGVADDGRPAAGRADTGRRASGGGGATSSGPGRPCGSEDRPPRPVMGVFSELSPPSARISASIVLMSVSSSSCFGIGPRMS